MKYSKFNKPTHKPVEIFFLLLIIFYSCQPVNHQTESLSVESNWPKSVIYEIFVQSFYDSNADGIGDFDGITSKLDYLQNLGVEGIWLMPINPSPSYHKYDVTDYYDVHPDYGTMDNFKTLLSEAHTRGIKVIMDLVVNHCSSEHPWFQQALADENSEFRDYFVWATQNLIDEKGTATKKITEDSDNIRQWNEVEGQNEKYFAYFWSGMPDLNYDNPKLKNEIFEIGQFWLKDVGVDGFRLDAVKHIFPDNRAEDNHRFWIEFRQEMEKIKPDVYLVGEVWDKAEVVAPYLNGIKSLLNFDLGFAITDAVNRTDATGLIEKYKEINDYYLSITDDFIDGTFIKNHDQDRILSALENNEDQAKMAAALLLTLPGTPFIYYGEEIGMKGLKPDENIREPFLWANSDSGQTKWMESKYSVPNRVAPLSQQMSDPASIYNHYKKLIAFRNSNQHIKLGSISSIDIQNSSVCAFNRELGGEFIEVYHNLSSKTQQISTGNKEILLETKSSKKAPGILSLQAYSTVILK